MKSKKLTICLGTIIAILSLASCGKENCFSTSFSNGYFLLTIPYIGKYNYRKSVKCFDDCEFNPC